MSTLADKLPYRIVNGDPPSLDEKELEPETRGELLALFELHLLWDAHCNSQDYVLLRPESTYHVETLEAIRYALLGL